MAIMRIATILAGTLLCAGLILLTRPEPQADLRELPPQIVTTVAVEQRDVRRVVWIAGKLQPSRAAELRFEVAGRVQRRLVEPGQRVTAGQALLEIDDGDYQDAVAEKSAQLSREISAIERDRALLALEEKEAALFEQELKRLAQLQRDSLASRSRYDEAEQRLTRQQQEAARLRHSVATAEARQRQKEAALAMARRNQERATLRAPFDGVVNQARLEEGDYVTPGQLAAVLVQARELDAYLEAPGALAENLSLGQTLNLAVDGEPLQGVLVALAVDPDPSTNTHGLRVRVDGAGLYPGKIAQVALPGRLYRDAKVVPATAALDEEDGSYVFALRRDKLFKQPVRIIARHEDLRIVEGIEPGALIVARNVAAYSDGQEVSVKQP